MTPTRKPANNINNQEQNSVPTNIGVPSPYLEPPPFYTTMVADFASRPRVVLSEEESLSLLLFEQKKLIRKYIPDGHRDLEKLWFTHKQEEMDVKKEPVVATNMKKEPLDASEGCSKTSVIPREMILCCICVRSPANMVWLPCRHLVVCSRCDNKSSTCPMCGIIKRSSFCV